MPILFLILGERLWLDVTLSTVPLHVFAKLTDRQSGATYNFEATSGTFARDSHYRKELPMTDAAIASGVYLKALSRREALALMATTILDHLLAGGRYAEAIAVADALLEAWPAHAYALVKKGTAFYRLRQREVIGKYARPQDIPPDQVAYANQLGRANEEAFARAEALGWREPVFPRPNPAIQAVDEGALP